ncbi:unnamed protein product [Mytilus coruscus]|uniref:Uncharacterized protein n=1 Tax=Mytilus coruscus TaxID=42192 RepID=A0A6J8EX39_MYTCO|nr:unnamed protein product [Mytilus coruscus]
MASQVDDNPGNWTKDVTDDDHDPTNIQQSGKGVNIPRIPIDLRDSQTHESNDDDMKSMSIDTLICLQHKQMNVLDNENKYTTNASHDSIRGTKRSRIDDDGEDNSLNKHMKMTDDYQHKTESVDELEKLVYRFKILDSKFKEIQSKYKRPENCQNLMIPSVNEDVWTEKHSMINAIRSRDLKLQKKMGKVIIGMIPAIEKTNDILKANQKKNTFEPAKNLKKMTDGIRMFAASYTQLQYRKENFKPIMVGKFEKLTYTNNSVSDKLFGDDLQKKIEDIQKSEKINVTGFTDKPSTSGYNYNRNSDEGYNNNKTGNGKCRFLDQRNSSRTNEEEGETVHKPNNR